MEAEKTCPHCGKKFNELSEERCERTVVLFAIAGHQQSEEAKTLLTMIPDFHHEVVPCTQSMAKHYNMPFIRLGEHPYYLLSGIRAFIRKQIREGKDVPAPAKCETVL
ncbi:MAG: hypothetical protein V4454_01270 [Pseudomonadota bacterium]